MPKNVLTGSIIVYMAIFHKQLLSASTKQNMKIGTNTNTHRKASGVDQKLAGFCTTKNITIPIT